MIKKFFRLLGPVLVLLVFLGAVWLLYHELKHYQLANIGASIWKISPWGFAIAVAMTVVNWIILIGYDLLAVRYVGLKLPLRRVALAAFCGYACSYNFGATLAGTTIRLRLYSAWNVPMMKILQLLVILGLTFWFGLFALAGVVFVTHPPQIVSHPQRAAVVHAAPASHAGNPSPSADEQAQQAKVEKVLDRIARIAANMRLWGVLLLTIALVYVGLSASGLHSVAIFGHRLPLPPLRLTIYQFAITSADMLIAGVVLYALMHNIDGIRGYFEILGYYLLVYVAVVLSHVPGGYGVFDGGMLFCLGLRLSELEPQAAEQFGPRVIAAILVFRIIYYWIPLLFAIPLLAINEYLLRRRAAAEPQEALSTR